jgi:hypothetical protein
MNRVLYLIATLLLGSALAACGTDSSSGSSAGDVAPASTKGVTVTSSGSTGSTGSKSGFSLQLTDAPVDGATAVVMEFVAVQLNATDGNWITYTFDTPQIIDLLKLQGTATVDLLANMESPSGDYNEIRLFVGASPMNNYITIAGKSHQLQMPGGSSSGLKIKGDFTIFKTRSASLVIDFDLRQSITTAGKSGKYKFTPVLRMANNENASHIIGTVDPAKLTTGCSDGLVDTFNAAYVYTGNVVPGDFGSGTEPFSSTRIAYDNSSMSYVYEAAFLPAGDYTIAFTCNADLDDLSKNDNLVFFDYKNVTVAVNNILFL